MGALLAAVALVCVAVVAGVALASGSGLVIGVIFLLCLVGWGMAS